jgi:single-stranded DNA-binding protein
MAMSIKQSLSGFVASAPVLTRTDQGETRLYMRIGQEHWTRNLDGSFAQGESSFHDLTMFRRAAERAAGQFAKGDRFVAEGYTHGYEWTNPDGLVEQREEFVARKIGHDNATTTYQVDRTPTRAETRQASSPAEAKEGVDEGATRPRNTPKVRQGPTNTIPAPATAGRETAGMVM